MVPIQYNHLKKNDHEKAFEFSFYTFYQYFLSTDFSLILLNGSFHENEK
jgi:hypothetical protein